MKYTQYCSVCKSKFDMEVIPTDDDEDDGVLWLRCPQCHGFLPRLNTDSKADTSADESDVLVEETDEMPTSTSAADIVEPTPPADVADAVEDGDTGGDTYTGTRRKARKPAPPPEDFSAELASMDVTMAVPYRPWKSYSVGDVVHHLAWDDCGVVVAEEVLPGRRKVIKVAFEKTGVHRLIVESDRS